MTRGIFLKHFSLVYFLVLLYSHDQLYKHIYICVQNHNDDTIKTSNTVLQKNIPLISFERAVCEWELETEQNCNILTPTLMAITVLLSRSTWLLNRGLGGPASPGASFLYRILSPSGLISNCSIGSPEGPSAGCWSSLPHLILSNWLNLQCTELYNNSEPTFFLWASRSRLYSDIPRPDAPVISYFDSLAGSEVNIQQFNLVIIPIQNFLAKPTPKQRLLVKIKF